MRQTWLKNMSCVMLGILFTVFLLLGKWTEGDFGRIGIFDLVGGLLCFLLFFCSCRWLMKLDFSRKPLSKQEEWWNQRVSWKKEGLLVLVLLLFFQILAVLATYPGIFGYDGPIQVYQVLNAKGELTAHHPVAHTLFLAGCFQLGKIFFHDYNTGLAVYTVIQSLIMTFSYSYTLIWLRKKGARLWIRLAAVLYYALHPVFALLGCNTTKDSLFSAFFLLTFLGLLDLLESFSRKKVIFFSANAFLMCLFRNQGYYLLFFSGLVLAVFGWKKYRKALLPVFLCAFAGYLMMGPLLSLLQIPRGDAREMLSLPMQQLALTWNLDEKGVIQMEPEDKEKLEKLVAPKYLTQYVPDSSDPVKYGFQTEVLKNDLAEYGRLYLRTGLENPRAYLMAFLSMTRPAWDIFEYGNYRGLITMDTFQRLNEYGIERTPYLPGYYRFLAGFSEGLSRFPVIRLIFGQVLSVWMLFFLIARSLAQRDGRLLAGYSLLAAQWLVLLLSPVVLVRYCLPLMLCAPVLLFQMVSPTYK